MIKRDLPFAKRKDWERQMQDFVLHLEKYYDPIEDKTPMDSSDVYDKFEDIIPLPLMHLLIKKETRDENYVKIYLSVKQARVSLDNNTVDEDGAKFCEHIQRQYKLR